MVRRVNLQIIQEDLEIFGTGNLIRRLFGSHRGARNLPQTAVRYYRCVKEALCQYTKQNQEYSTYYRQVGNYSNGNCRSR